ncbi:MAG: addiction module toxin, HicA family [Fibrobacter sp.]|jgi:predicted RNA binding protein YcfA (HicA-like mRNA interferase family)|nr:addiction module toxin, HicA family [Fibrobacter sp.]
MSFPEHVWKQIKNKTCDEIISALEKDGWKQDVTIGPERIYRKGKSRVSIHYHPKMTYGPGLLKALLKDIGWTEKEMRKLKFIK